MGAAISLAVSDLGQPSCYSQSPEQGVGWGDDFRRSAFRFLPSGGNTETSDDCRNDNSGRGMLTG
jgi:hypothetical protein